MFTRIDYDGSGDINIQEMYDIFKENGIKMSKEEMEKFFSLCETEQQGRIKLDEFKQLYTNQKTDELFRLYVKRSRELNQKAKD